MHLRNKLIWLTAIVLIQSVLKMRSQHSGHIVNIPSGSVHKPQNSLSFSYVATGGQFDKTDIITIKDSKDVAHDSRINPEMHVYRQPQ